jgi:inner membrane protein
MATIISHAIAAGLLYKVISPLKERKTLRICLIAAILPDADVIGFRFGVPYEAMLGHRGFTHSIVFALLFAGTCLVFYRGYQHKLRYFLLFFITTMSHGLFDMLTNGGYGVGLLIPFTAKRYFFPITPIEVSPIGRHFFSYRGLEVLMSETVWILLPCALIYGIHWVLNRKKSV